MKVKDITYISLLTAVLCITAPISLPLGTIPLSLASFFVMLITGVAGIKGFFSVVLYVFLGAFGLPVFSGFTGGFQQLVGVTGGFIVGYIFSGLFICIVKADDNKFLYYMKMYAANIIIYVFGVLWFMCLSGAKFLTSLTICVFPFVILDILKATIAAYLSIKLKRRLEKSIEL